MACEFPRLLPQIKSKNGGISLVALVVLSSILAIQYIELPYRNSVLSLLPYAKSYANSTQSPPVEKLRPENRSTEVVSPKADPIISPISPYYIAPSPRDPFRPVDADEIIAFEGNTTVADLSPLAPAVSPLLSMMRESSNSTSDSSSVAKKLTNNDSVSAMDRANAGESRVVSLSEMNDMLRESHSSSNSKSPLWPTTADRELKDARFAVEYESAKPKNRGLYAPIYRNLTRFLRSYELMEKKLKVYVYRDGKRPVFHNPRLRGIYASEGWFMKQMESSDRFLTRKPEKAHLFYLPFSSQLLVDYVYVKDSHSFDDINRFLKDYVRGIKSRYAFWNRTDGSDHFLVACHDWAPFETRHLMANAIRAMCNADIKEGFRPGRDASLPETYVRNPENPMKTVGGSPPSKRKILAFFAGQMHGHVRPVLLKHWTANEYKDRSMKIFGRMKKGSRSYQWHMKNSRYCICPRGYEVNSPRVVEAILYGCVPVILSDDFAPPFFEVLNWEAFAVFVREGDVPKLKEVLDSIPEERYRAMFAGVEKARLHFVWHFGGPMEFDVFHMVLHSVWYNRVFS